MSTVIEIIGIVIAVILLAVIVMGALFAAVVIYNDRKWEKIKSDKYEQHNKEKVHQV